MVISMEIEYGKKPLAVIQKHLNQVIKVTLKNDISYEGKMVDCDNYMNLVIEKAIEYHGNDKKAGYANVLIRGNNILYIQFSI